MARYGGGGCRTQQASRGRQLMERCRQGQACRSGEVMGSYSGGMLSSAVLEGRLW